MDSSSGVPAGPGSQGEPVRGSAALPEGQRSSVRPGALLEHPDPAPRSGRHGALGWINPDWHGAPAALLGDPRDALELLCTLEPHRWLRRIPRRGTFAWDPARSPADEAGAVPVEGESLVVKRFIGDLARDRWYARLRTRANVSPAQREGLNLRALRRTEFAVPRPLAWFEEPGLRGRSALVMEHLDHSEHLRAAVDREGSESQRDRLDYLARLIGRLHDAGWYHRDLYLEHVVITGSEPHELALIDVGRARCQAEPRRRWFVKDVAALLHSSPEGVPAHARLRFLTQYLDARGILEPEPRRQFQHEVERKAARLAAHSPRYVDLHLDPL